MCVAILNKKGVTLKKDLLKACWDNNNDGAGLAYPKDGRIEIFKELKSFDKFYDEYAAIREEYRGNMLLHFRIATHGAVTEENCHPFLVSDTLAFVHNGVISNVGASKDKSDTKCFNEKVLQLLPEGFTDNAGIKLLVEEFIGHSKLAFLDAEGNYSIYNEAKGVWDMDCWFSNVSYKPKPVYSTTAVGGYKYSPPLTVGIVYWFLKDKHDVSASVKLFGQEFVFYKSVGKWRTVGALPQYDKTVPPMLINPSQMEKALEIFEKGHLKKYRLEIPRDALGRTTDNNYDSYFGPIEALKGQIVFTWHGLGLVVDEDSPNSFQTKNVILNMGVYQNDIYAYDTPKKEKYQDKKHRNVWSNSIKVTTKWCDWDIAKQLADSMNKAVEVNVIN